MHDCYRCGDACYCHGDIDDCPVETVEYAYEHCVGCGCEEDEEFDDDYDIDFDDMPASDEPPSAASAPELEAAGQLRLFP